jgi:hypothetical protein
MTKKKLEKRDEKETRVFCVQFRCVNKIIIQQQAPSAAFKIVCVDILSMNAFFVAQRSLREGSGGFFASRDVSVRVFRPPRASSVDGEI